jgi:hypothetical protein
MKPGIHISKIWFDEDAIELRIGVSDGTSFFSNKVYVGHRAFGETISSLNIFRDHIHGGLLDVQYGEFGPEYANGAFHARFHFLNPGKLYVSCKQESDYEEFANKNVASRATMYISSEPILLDRFITELKAIAAGTSEEAYLESI